jgi:hypothetical protein
VLPETPVATMRMISTDFTDAIPVTVFKGVMQIIVSMTVAYID